MARQATKVNSLEHLEQIRADIESAKAAIERIRSARLNPGDLPAHIDGIVDGWARQVDSAALGQWLSTPGHSAFDDLLSNACPTLAGKGRIAQVLALIDPDRLKDRLTEIAQPWADPGAVLLADRDAAIHEAELELFGLEVTEERVIETLEADGIEVFRRGDADPSIVLACGLED